MALQKFATHYASITPFLKLEKSFVSDIDLKHDSNWTGDLWRSLMKIQTSRWYQIPQIMEFPTGDRSRVFLISPPDGFHVFAKERIATTLLAFGDRPTSKLTQHPRLWSRRLGIILKDYGGYANAVNFDNNKFVHKKIWYDVWCDRNHAFLLPMPDEDYLTWVRTASIRSEDELEAVTIARNRQFRETMRRRRFCRGTR